MKKLTALIILDGFGYREEKRGNAIAAAQLENIPRLAEKYPHTLLSASGLSVGLPEGQMGNSEVGHLNMGAGRVVYQELTRIDESIRSGEFYTNPAFTNAIENCKTKNSSLHLMGLCSDGGVHSHTNHVYALLKMAKDAGLKNVYIHCFTDGRDTPPDSGIMFIDELENKIAELKCGKIATVCGRYYAMDRDKRYERIQKAYDALCLGRGNEFSSAREIVLSSYSRGVTDEFIEPGVVTEFGKPIGVISANDSVIFFNIRPDRARELTYTLILPDKELNAVGFTRVNSFIPLHFVTMTGYDDKIANRVHVAFERQSLKNVLGEYIAQKGMTQLRIAETEKYAHVTFFFNGGVETMYMREDRALIPSPKVATYDECPEMSAYLVTQECIRRISSGVYDLIILNFANTDMVGHTGDFDATVKAAKVVDECVGQIYDYIHTMGGCLCVTADHGNSEEMISETGEVITFHTCAKVPFILADDEYVGRSLRKNGALCDIAPTLLKLMGLRKPKEMTGKSLLIPQK